jgi:hypothetical protein
MFPPNLEDLVHEQHEDRLRDLEQQHLLQTAGLNPSINLKIPRKAVQWLGGQMVKWGTKLQG